MARLMTRRYANALLSMRERPVSFDALSARVGFLHRVVPSVKALRRQTTYSFSRRAALFLDSMLAYGSRLPHVFAVVAASIIVVGVCSFFLSERALTLVLIFAASVIVAGIALLYRYCDLILQEIRYTPANIRRIYPDE